MKYPALYRVILGVSLACCGAARGAGPVDVPDRVEAAVADLASGDPAQRDKAAKALLAMGPEARQAVVEASRSDVPELRSRAAELLMRFPWYREDDSEGVRTLLAKYGSLGVDERRQIVVQLAGLTQHGFDALGRLIVEEPSDDVKWVVVSAVRQTYRPNVLDAFRGLDTGIDSAPLLAAAGHAWMSMDAKRGANLLRQSLALDLEHPARDGGEVAVAFERLRNLALLAGDYDQVARLLRMHAARAESEDPDEPTRPVLDLFAAHATFGPLDGFEKDLETYKEQLSDPRVMFALGKIYQRTGRPMLATAVYRSAFLVDLVSVQDRLAQGDFLMRHGWLDLAEGEFRTVFDLTADHSNDSGRAEPMTPELDQANAHFRLSQVAAARDDDAAASEHMKQAMEAHYKGHGQLSGSSDDAIWQEINWHALRAAKKKGNPDEVNRLLGTFLSTANITNPDVANDVVPLLRDLGRPAQAKAVYDKVRQSLEDRSAEMVGHPMPKNNIAWLGARTGEGKHEALRLATEATQSMPDNAAFVDTLAEAHFQLGNYAEAARLEAKVVRARPADRFLQEQLRKFEAAAAAKGKGKQ